ncbi:MAG TPA: NUDIX hydrolase [Planctomycetota bacterium]
MSAARGAAGDGDPAPGLPLSCESRVVLRGAIFDVVSAQIVLSSGVTQDLLVVEHPGAVAIAPVTESGELVLVRQYRHAAREVLLELPAGRLEPGEEPLAAARRELAEETGRSARRWRALATFLPAPGFCSERIHLFEARELEPVPQHLDPDEDLEVVLLPPERVLALARDAKTLLAASWLLMGR